MVYIPPPVKGAFVQIGDYVSKVGIYTNPGVVEDKNEDGTIIVNTDKEEIQRYHRHSITTGLTPDEKDIFNDIMDGVMDIEANSDRIIELQGIIDEMRGDPELKSVSDRLRNEQAQLIRLSRELPQIYFTQPEKLR